MPQERVLSQLVVAKTKRAASMLQYQVGERDKLSERIPAYLVASMEQPVESILL